MSTTICHPAADWSCYGDAEKVAALDEVDKEFAESLAWAKFASLTAHAVAICPTTFRPCRKGCTVNMRLDRQLWSWLAFDCGCSLTGCGCTAAEQVRLRGKVGAVTSVRIDGATLDPTAYRVDDGRWLVRTDGGSWPLEQNLNLDDDQPGTFSVTYYDGHAPNDMDKRAVGILAAEFLKACEGKNCSLPPSLVSVARQGVTYQVRSDTFTADLTGIREVDALVKYYNPNLLKKRPRISSPDTIGGRVTTWRKTS